MIDLERVDHLVLTVGSLEKTIEFYTRVLGMKEVTFGEGRKALAFGSHKINLHQAGREFEPKAEAPTPGSADLCLIARTPMTEVLAHLAAQGVEPLFPPSPRSGALGPIESVYLRDPDGNLIEISNYPG